MLCTYLKKILKTGFEIQNYISRTHEMKNRILSKNKGCLFFLLPKISTARILYNDCPKNIFLSNFFFWGGGQLPPSFPPSPPTPTHTDIQICESSFIWALRNHKTV